MPFLPGNDEWKKRNWSGPRPIYDDPQLVWDKFVEYFEACQDNPLLEQKIVTVDNQVKHVDLTKKRAPTKAGLCSHLEINLTTWARYGEPDHDLCSVVEAVNQIIYDDKLSAAMAGLLNSNLVARDLHLADRQEVDANVDVTPWATITCGDGEGDGES